MNLLPRKHRITPGSTCSRTYIEENDQKKKKVFKIFSFNVHQDTLVEENKSPYRAIFVNRSFRSEYRHMHSKMTFQKMDILWLHIIRNFVVITMFSYKVLEFMILNSFLRCDTWKNKCSTKHTTHNPRGMLSTFSCYLVSELLFHHLIDLQLSSSLSLSLRHIYIGIGSWIIWWAWYWLLLFPTELNEIKKQQW